MNGHIDIERLSRYFLSILPPEEETAVQEHLRTCPRCAARLEAMRKLRKGFEEDREASGRKTVFFRVIRSGWTKAAAAAVVAAAVSIITLETVRDRSSILEQHEIMDGEQIENQVFAIDTFDKEDSTYYRNKYGEDFKF